MAGKKTNRQILTQGKNYRDKQIKKFGADEITFDKDSRNEYLTGFHKRKVQRQKKAQEYHKEQERLIRIEERKKIRDERKKDLAEQLEKVKEAMKEAGDYVGSDAEASDMTDPSESESESEAEDTGNWSGFEDEAKPILKKRKDVYDDAEVDIEPLEPNDNFEYLAKINNVKLEKSEEVLEKSITRAQKYAKIAGVVKPKQKKKKFRYLTKTERRENNRKASANARRK